MKLASYLFCFVTCLICGCKPKFQQHLPFTFDEAILKEDLPNFILACGTVSTADALLFRSANSDSCIIGIVQCVSLYDQNFFKKGVKYRLQVTQNNIEDSLKNYIVQNGYKEKNCPVFLVTHISKAK